MLEVPLKAIKQAAVLEVGLPISAKISGVVVIDALVDVAALSYAPRGASTGNRHDGTA